MRIGVDLLGSDAPPEVLVQALREASAALPSDFTLVGIGSPDLAPLEGDPIEFMLAPEAIGMEDDPLHAVRRKKGSSMVMGIQAVANGELDALVSAGNTGALVAAATLHLPKLPAILRPGLLAEIATRKGSLVVIDVGGHIHAEMEHLIRFACLGIAFQRCLNKVACPRVGLLNIGQESLKGTRFAQEVYRRLRDLEKEIADLFPFSFEGNVEGREAYQGGVDVLVTDGFTGNVFLKASEGVSLFLMEEMGRILKLPEDEEAAKAFEALKKRVLPEEYPGALVMGLDGLVVKCHGEASVASVKNAILGTSRLLEKNVLPCLRNGLARLDF